MARPRLELGTPRFSGTGSCPRKSHKSPANRRVADRGCSTSIPVDCCSYSRVKDVAGPPRPFRLLRATAAWASKASATPALGRAAPHRPTQASRWPRGLRLLSGRKQHSRLAAFVYDGLPTAPQKPDRGVRPESLLRLRLPPMVLPIAFAPPVSFVRFTATSWSTEPRAGQHEGAPPDRGSLIRCGDTPFGADHH